MIPESPALRAFISLVLTCSSLAWPQITSFASLFHAAAEISALFSCMRSLLLQTELGNMCLSLCCFKASFSQLSVDLDSRPVPE